MCSFFSLLNPQHIPRDKMHSPVAGTGLATCQFISSKATLHLPVLNLSLSVDKPVHRRREMAKTGLFLTVTMRHIRSPLRKIGLTQFYARSVFLSFQKLSLLPLPPVFDFRSSQNWEISYWRLLKMAGPYSKLVQILKHLGPFGSRNFHYCFIPTPFSNSFKTCKPETM